MKKDRAIVLDPSYARICQYADFQVGTRCRCSAGQRSEDHVNPAPAKASRRLRSAASPVNIVPVPVSPVVAPLPTAAPRFPVTPSAFKSTSHRFQRYHRTYHSIERIAQQLTDRANSELPKSKSAAGYIYVYTYPDPDMEGLVKIGCANDVQVRMKKIQNDCKRIPQVIEDPLQRPVKHAYRAEQLVFDVLHNHRMKVRACAGCRKDHIEWFTIQKEFALRVIEQVRLFMEDRYGPASPDHTDKCPGTSKPRLRQLVEMARQLAQQEDTPVADDSSDIHGPSSKPPLPSSCRTRRDVVKSQDDPASGIPPKDIPCDRIVITIQVQPSTSALSSNPQESQDVYTLERERRNMRPPETRCGDGACRLNVHVKIPINSRQSQ